MQFLELVPFKCTGKFPLKHNTAQRISNKHLRDTCNQNVLAKDWCLLNTGAFQYICLFWELITYLLNIQVATKTDFTADIKLF